MEMLLWWGVAIVLYIGISFFSRAWGKTAFFCFGVGGALNANFYNIGTYPLNFGGVIYGFDSSLYSIFVFCAIYFYLRYGKRDARDLNYAAIGAIIFLALIDLIARLTAKDNTGLAWGLFSYAVSALATYAAIEGAIFACEFVKKKNSNSYLLLIVGSLVATIVNSVIYFGLIAAVQGFAENFGSQLIGSFAGKFICIGLSCFAYFLIGRWAKKEEKGIKELE